MPGVPAFKKRNNPLLPESAPKVRLTIGSGTTHHSTRSFRRPVTLIGSGRRCDVILANRAVQKAHCVILNDGKNLILKNLCAENATLLGVKPVSQSLLEDGQLIQLGAASIQVAIHSHENLTNDMTGAFDEVVNPFALPEPLYLQESGGRNQKITEGPFLIGRQSGADLVLSDRDVSLAHAIIFGLNGSVVIADLGSRNGIQVNGNVTTLASLNSGSVFAIGSHEFLISNAELDGSVASMNLNDTAKAQHLVELEHHLEKREQELEHREEIIEQREKSLEEREKKLEIQLARLSSGEAPKGSSPGILTRSSMPASKTSQSAMGDSHLKKAETLLTGARDSIHKEH